MLHLLELILTLSVTGNANRNNFPIKRLISGTFLCAVLGTLRARFCVLDTVLDVPDIWFVILILPGICTEIEIDLNPLNAGN